jgi:putative hydroxymethylpyrimidine transport system permease protein
VAYPAKRSATIHPRLRKVAGGSWSFARALIFGFVAVLLAWQAAVWLAGLPPFLLPAPGAVLDVFLNRFDFLARHAGITLAEAVLGLILGSGIGAATAIGIAAFPRLGRLVWPLVLVLQALPVFAIAPLLVIWFGFGLASKLVMTTLITFFPVASAFADGLRRTDRDILDACALTDATPWQALRYIRIPLALPALISGLRVAAPLAPLGAVVGEWVGASGGLGFIMLQANARLQTAEVFAALTLIAAMTLTLRALVDGFSKLLAPWASERPFDPKEISS